MKHSQCERTKDQYLKWVPLSFLYLTVSVRTPKLFKLTSKYGMHFFSTLLHKYTAYCVMVTLVQLVITVNKVSMDV